MKKRLTFFTFGEDVFLRDIIIGLRPYYDIKFYQKGTEEEFYRMYHDCDVAWFEWCDMLVANAMQHPKMGRKVITRLHSYELFTDVPRQVDWNKVDKLVFVSNHVKDLFRAKFGIRPDIMTTINNGVDVKKFTILKDKKYNKKVAFVGYLNYKKAPELLLHAFYEIWKHDPEFQFHIAGEHQDERIALYFDNLLKNLPFKINFDGWREDIPKYLEDKDYIMSTSLFESFQYSIAEGMAQGLVPLIHNWTGSEGLYPKEFIFNTFDQAVEIVKNFESVDDKNIVRNNLRKFVEDNYSLESKIEEIRNMIELL